MAINYTPDQLKVIELHGCNVLVSAAAGSGKTAVLVERIIRMICDENHPVDIDRLLIVTFTNAAAAEMRERIAAGIARRLEEEPSSEHLQRQSALLHNAQITTIDSFCLFLIRNHFNEIGLDPGFRVADEGEVKLLQQEVMAELLEETFAAENPAFYEAVEYFCTGGREQVLEEHILDLSRYASSYPWPEGWLKARKRDYGAGTEEELLASDYGRFLDAHVRKLLLGAIDKMRSVQKLCEQPDGPYMYGELVDRELEQLERVMAAGDFQQIGLRLEGVEFSRLPTKKDDSVNPLKREYAKNLRTEVKDTLKEISTRLYATPLWLAVTQGRACVGPVNTLLDLVLEFRARMKEKKQERKILDFSDMEHYALDILLEHSEPDEEGVVTMAPSRVALEYRQFFEEILIDEYQDSNHVQELLLSVISGEAEGRFNRFMVGDVKQSIYKFRLAEPGIFLEKYDSYSNEGREKCRIDLSKNFRSRTQVVDCVNQVFQRVMNDETCGMAYDEKAMLYRGADYYPENTGCETELLLVQKPDKEAQLDVKGAEALAIAQRIHGLKQEFRVMDKGSGKLRPVRYADMVILLRTTSGWDEAFKKVLEEQGIPVYITSKTGYFAATEVQEVLQLLRVIDNPLQDIPLYGVMKSLFGGFSEEEIAILRAGQKKRPMYEALNWYVQRGETQEDRPGAKEEQLKDRVGVFLDKLKAYRSYVTYLPIRDLIQRLLQDHDYFNYVAALPGGSKRLANVEMLLTKASDFEQTSYHGLFHFVRYIEQLEKYDVDYGEADTLDENADVVRIMSIHKSKGLEFPVTFVSGLSKRFNMQDANQSLIVDMQLGLACDYVNLQSRVRNKTFRRLAVSRKLKEDNLAEELRVLYVAFTRAREKLILTAGLDKAAEKWEAYRENPVDNLGYGDFYGAGTYLDMLLPVLAHTDIQVQVLEDMDLQAAAFQEQGGMMERKERLSQAGNYADKEALDRLQHMLNYTYPHKCLEKLYTKTTVSELKIAAMAQQDEAAYHAFEEQEIVPYLPGFRREQESVSGAVRGNAYHRVMELLDFQQVLGSVLEGPVTVEEYLHSWEQEENRQKVAAALRKFLEQLVAEGRLSGQYYQAIRQVKLLHFLSTPLAYRMWSAQRRGELYREQPFVYGVAASLLGEDFPEDEKVLIQGIIDVFWIENGQIVLLDYKTDVVEHMKQLWNRYGTQMDYYEEALSGCMEKTVKEKILYSFYLERYEE